ncbi:MAG: M28 family peptidase [Planctomycetales bacterium]|nr:M28 family peptidase [Planctomycetales bacterium]NIM08071.1 M28 family peptidase [Planctomycetales bacterium]NIN07562.1 M28 family peptidase [Planctomycetales bacterium]NIN76669.1 M28 family peptidase [Planctomycetales bacterium]NIO33857.1 M28 family peptidase [Planctomycetales bacterium]
MPGNLCSSILVACLLFACGCNTSHTAEPRGKVGRPANPRSSDEVGQAGVVPSQFAAAGSPLANPLQPQRAMRYLQQICQLGPRVTGSAAMAAQQELLVNHFEQLGGQVHLQRFRIRHPLTTNPVPVANLIVQWHPEMDRRILLCAHYDTRPQADNPQVAAALRGQVFLGANDGASGVALLMELAHFVPQVAGNYGVDFLLVDAEEFVFPGTKKQRYFIGSEYFARNYAARPEAVSYSYPKAAVLDMIGDRELQIYQDRNSIWWRDTRPVTREIWDVARRLGVKEFIPRTHPRMKQPIQDDHLMLRNVGKIPTCEIIDFDYPKFPLNRYWHTDQDTPDKCSGASLVKVGWVILEWLKTAA